MCQNCQRPFHISDEDARFYRRINVPHPTFCPNCRLQRRLAFRNERTLYKRSCDLCRKSVISMYSPERDLQVYCPDCFFSDRWDPMDYGRPYDFKKPFFEQWLHLQQSIPHLSLFQQNTVNSPWVNYELDAKNCYLNVGGHLNEDCAYNQYLLKCRDCFDNYWLQNSEFCYESTFCENCYKTWFSILCFDCRDTYFSFDCRDCSNIIGCSGLRHKQYHIFNKPVSKEEYEQFLVDHPFSSHKSLASLRLQAHALWHVTPQRALFTEQSSNVSGQVIRESKDCLHCTAVDKSEHVSYGMFLKEMRDAMDVTSIWNGELLYEVMGGAEKLFHIMFSAGMLRGSRDIQYSYLLSNCHNCFGCINLRDKSYCILNKQYSPSEYHELILQQRHYVTKNVVAPQAKIIAHMNEMPFTDRKGHVYRYGEFFPFELSPFGYHETVAQEYFPSRHEPLVRDQIPPTLMVVPDDISDVSDEIIGEVLRCESSGKPYRIIPMELEFYRRFGLPIPHEAPFERHRRRLRFISDHRQIYTRQCSSCHQETNTVYLKTEFSHVYCELCYQRQIL